MWRKLARVMMYYRRNCKVSSAGSSDGANAILISAGKSKGWYAAATLRPRKSREFLKLHKKNALGSPCLLLPLRARPGIPLPEPAWYLSLGFPENRGTKTRTQEIPPLKWAKLRAVT